MDGVANKVGARARVRARDCPLCAADIGTVCACILAGTPQNNHTYSVVCIVNSLLDGFQNRGTT